jgi:ABC-type transport system substrate-binding protein
MKRSRYDTDADGLCDAPECTGVLHISRPSPPWTEMTGIIQSSLRKIGIELETRPKEDAYSVIQRLPNEIPITSAPGWVKDYPDPFSFIGFLFDGRNIRRPANTNYAMVGLDRSRARELDIPVPKPPVPSVDAGIDRCVATLAAEERNDCWAELDRHIMTEVVPWIPYLEANKLVVTSDAISPYEFDQFSGEISFAHIGIDRSL